MTTDNRADVLALAEILRGIDDCPDTLEECPDCKLRAKHSCMAAGETLARALSRPVPEGFVLVPRCWALEARQIASSLEDQNSTKALALPDAVSFLRRLAATIDPGRPVPHHGSGPAEVFIPRKGPRHD